MDVNRFRPFLYWVKRSRPTSAGREWSPAQSWAYIIWIQESGTGILKTVNGEAILRPGQAAICDPGSELRWQRTVSYLRIAFDLIDRPRELDPLSQKSWHPEPPTPQPPLQEIFGVPFPMRIPAAAMPRLSLLSENGVSTWWRSQGDHVRCTLELGRWIIDLAQAHGATCFERTFPAVDIPLTEQADMLIDQEFRSGWGIAKLAAYLGVSREHLSRTYRQDRGISIHAALAQRRMRAALVAIEHSNDSLEYIARQYGFGSQDTMCRQCVRYVGRTPQEHRRMHRKQLIS